MDASKTGQGPANPSEAARLIPAMCCATAAEPVSVTLLPLAIITTPGGTLLALGSDTAEDSGMTALALFRPLGVAGGVPWLRPWGLLLAAGVGMPGTTGLACWMELPPVKETADIGCSPVGVWQ